MEVLREIHAVLKTFGLLGWRVWKGTDFSFLFAKSTPRHRDCRLRWFTAFTGVGDTILAAREEKGDEGRPGTGRTGLTSGL